MPIKTVHYSQPVWTTIDVDIDALMLRQIYTREKDNLALIKPIGTHNQRKTPREHLTTTLLGKLAEHFLRHLFTKNLPGIKIEHSKMSHGYELFDFNLVSPCQSLTCELRTSFAPSRYLISPLKFLELSHIGPYTNSFKTFETPKDLYFQMLWMRERATLVSQIPTVLAAPDSSFAPVTLKVVSFATYDLFLKSGQTSDLGQPGTKYHLISPFVRALPPSDGFTYINNLLALSPKSVPGIN